MTFCSGHRLISIYAIEGHVCTGISQKEEEKCSPVFRKDPLCTPAGGWGLLEPSGPGWCGCWVMTAAGWGLLEPGGPRWCGCWIIPEAVVNWVKRLAELRVCIIDSAKLSFLLSIQQWGLRMFVLGMTCPVLPPKSCFLQWLWGSGRHSLPGRPQTQRHSRELTSELCAALSAHLVKNIKIYFEKNKSSMFGF